MHCFGVLLLLCASALTVFGQANGKLQIHFMDVGQGDGAVLISPLGEVVLFDTGTRNRCHLPVSYLQRLRIDRIDYLIASHYHSDHIGCAAEVLGQFPLVNVAIDRGDSYDSAAYRSYEAAVRGQRRTALTGEMIILDSGSPNPVRILIIALNADGRPTTDENSLSVAALISFGAFRAEIGGDLVGTTRRGALDVETPIGPRVGLIDVYKVHHHCSQYSTNGNWANVTAPTVAIVSAGNGNIYRHPTADCLDRLHSVGTITYWTEDGNGAEPDPAFDLVAGDIVVEMAPDDVMFTVIYGGGPPDTYPVRGR